MGGTLFARRCGTTFWIGTTRIGTTGYSMHAGESAPSIEVAHVESKNLLWRFTSRWLSGATMYVQVIFQTGVLKPFHALYHPF